MVRTSNRLNWFAHPTFFFSCSHRLLAESERVPGAYAYIFLADHLLQFNLLNKGQRNSVFFHFSFGSQNHYLPATSNLAKLQQKIWEMNHYFILIILFAETPSYYGHFIKLVITVILLLISYQLSLSLVISDCICKVMGQIASCFRSAFCPFR